MNTRTGSRTESAPRRYTSPLRAERARQTRASLVAAATDLFTSNGWAATGMRDVAREAGVAVETLYSHFPSKRILLQGVIDEAVAGDDAPLPMAERPEFLAIGRGRRGERIASAAALATAINERTVAFARLIREAATTDEGIAEILGTTRERQRQDVGTALGLLLGRPATEDERDGTWAIVSPEVYLLLVGESGWSPGRYERWLSDTLARVLPRS